MTLHPLTPSAGFGLGMRRPHFADFVSGQVEVDFVEVISENFMVAGGRPLHVIDRVREHYPVALHGVSMSIGAADGLNRDYLRRLKALAERVQPIWVSDHLCWTGAQGVNSHDLLPVPFTMEALEIVCRNVAQAQETLERPILLENPSSYVTFAEDHEPEWVFLAEVVRRTGCSILLDVNNIFVSATNHGFDPSLYLDALPLDRVRQIHLAGHSHGRDGLLIDTHDAPVRDEVWDLFSEAIARCGPVLTMIERDDHIPPLAELCAELAQARAVASRALAASAGERTAAHVAPAAVAPPSATAAP